ncbi:MAG: SynChlorMet cassette radical SAM/SPASM protein ScmF [Candidatus Aminicenantes bacterium RBG_13_62_12]|nr:MAG: SynChlorMet cassette radical SAM/SPASM protein ScmF [Candidatus Aminicenantes bacterium RBG_13_62_12]
MTEGCNLACRHCWIAPKLQQGETVYPMLDFDLMPFILRQAKPLGLQSVKLTGGEPLMHPKIFSILEHVRSEDLGCTVETNGVLCTPDLARELARQKNCFVSVSLDGADAETNEWVRGIPGCFDAAVRGIKNLAEAGIRPQIILTVMKRNRHQVEAVVRLAEKLGAGSVKFNVLMPTARGEDMHKRGEALAIEELVELGHWVETELSARTPLRLIFHHPAVFRPLGRIFGRDGDGCSRCGIFTILGVLADGSYALCGIGETVPELVFGRAGRDRLDEIWNNHPLLKEIREGLPGKLKGVCGDCLMKSLCLGSCVAQNYYSSRDLFSPFWYCEEARKKGLFPSSRLGR